MSKKNQSHPDLQAQQLYLDFLVQVERHKLDLDALSLRLLNAVGLAWYQGQRLTVLQVAHDFEQQSSWTTTYRRLSELRAKKLVSYTLDEKDNRVKLLAPTQLAIDYFNHLGRVISQLQLLNAIPVMAKS